MTLSLRRIESSSAVNAALSGSVIKVHALAEVETARTVIERAKDEAARLLDEARAKAEALADQRLQEREDALSRRQQELEQRLWRSAADYAEAVGREWEQSLADMEAGATALVGKALARLVEQVPAHERLRACVAELIAQAGVPDTGVLLVAAEDQAAVQALGDRVPWPVQCSGEVAAGVVRLVCTQGRWECDVGSALERLLDALGAPVEHAGAVAAPAREDEEADHV